MARGIRLFGAGGRRMARLVAAGVPAHGALSRREEAHLPSVGANARPARNVGDCPGAVAHRPRLVVLRLLASAVPERHARFQSGKDLAFCLDPFPWPPMPEISLAATSPDG